MFDKAKTSKDWTEDALNKAKTQKLPLVADRKDWIVDVDYGKTKTGIEGGKDGTGGDLTKIRLVFNSKGELITAYPTK